jgi:hypothetical protein
MMAPGKKVGTKITIFRGVFVQVGVINHISNSGRHMIWFNNVNTFLLPSILTASPFFSPDTDRQTNEPFPSLLSQKLVSKFAHAI